MELSGTAAVAERCSRKPRMRRAAVNDDWGSCAAGICEPLVARFAKPLRAAHFPLAAALLVARVHSNRYEWTAFRTRQHSERAVAVSSFKLERLALKAK